MPGRGFFLDGRIVKTPIMKSFLNLILPGNPLQRMSGRGVKDGRKAYGFSFGQPAFRDGDGVAQGINAPLPADVTVNATATINITTRVNYLTYAAGTVTANMPPVAGVLRDVYIIKNGANGVTVNRFGTDTGNIFLSAGAAAGTSATVATATVARFVSDGTSWYRVQ